jgi:hypothetical protein
MQVETYSKEQYLDSTVYAKQAHLEIAHTATYN